MCELSFVAFFAVVSVRLADYRVRFICMYVRKHGMYRFEVSIYMVGIYLCSAMHESLATFDPKIHKLSHSWLAGIT